MKTRNRLRKPYKHIIQVRRDLALSHEVIETIRRRIKARRIFADTPKTLWPTCIYKGKICAVYQDGPVNYIKQ